MRDSDRRDKRETIFFCGECLNCITMQGVASGMQRVSEGREDRREIASTKMKREMRKIELVASRSGTLRRGQGGREKEREHEGGRGRPNWDQLQASQGQLTPTTTRDYCDGTRLCALLLPQWSIFTRTRAECRCVGCIASGRKIGDQLVAPAHLSTSWECRGIGTSIRTW